AHAQYSYTFQRGQRFSKARPLSRPTERSQASEHCRSCETVWRLFPGADCLPGRYEAWPADAEYRAPCSPFASTKGPNTLESQRETGDLGYEIDGPPLQLVKIE